MQKDANKRNNTLCLYKLYNFSMYFATIRVPRGEVSLSSSYTQDTERNSNYGGGDESVGFLPLAYYYTSIFIQLPLV